jgi:hypothetical protein
VLLSTGFIHAQATRTWVSGVGDDANPCSRTAPCKTFAGAISKTAAGGEIDALDPAGYGALTITKAITIDGGQVGVASVLVSGTNGIVVSGGPNDVVTLRNLSITGAGTGINGVRFLAGKALVIQNIDIFGFTANGLDIALGATGQVSLKNSSITNVGGDGVSLQTTSGLASLIIDNSRIDFVSRGIHGGNHSRTIVRNSTVSYAGTVGVVADTGDSEITLGHSFLYNDSIGAQAGAAGTFIYLSDSEIAYNATALSLAGGAIVSFGTNRLHSNGSNGTISSTLAQQ